MQQTPILVWPLGFLAVPHSAKHSKAEWDNRLQHSGESSQEIIQCKGRKFKTFFKTKFKRSCYSVITFWMSR